jgi:glutathione S-transferase
MEPIYRIWNSGQTYVRAVQMGLEEKGAAYRLHALGFGESKSPEHLQRHAFGRVPAFEHGDFRLYETQAILRYLDDVIPEPSFRRDRRTARHWAEVPGKPTDESAIAAALPQAQVCIKELERLLGSQPFMAGEQLSIADLMLAPQLDNLALTPEGKSLLVGTRLEAWLARMNTRPSMVATRRSETPHRDLP